MRTARVYALTQFLIIGMGGAALAILVKIGHENPQPEALARSAQFLAAHVLWLFAIPILFAAIGSALNKTVDEKYISIAGATICAILLLVLGSLVILYLL